MVSLRRSKSIVQALLGHNQVVFIKSERCKVSDTVFNVIFISVPFFFTGLQTYTYTKIIKENQWYKHTKIKMATFRGRRGPLSTFRDSLSYQEDDLGSHGEHCFRTSHILKVGDHVSLYAEGNTDVTSGFVSTLG